MSFAADDRYDDPVAHRHRRDESFTTSKRSARAGIEDDTDSDSDDSTDRALEKELWDEEEEVGDAADKKPASKSRIMHAIGKEQQYSAVGRSGSRRSSNSRQQMNSLGAGTFSNLFRPSAAGATLPHGQQPVTSSATDFAIAETSSPLPLGVDLCAVIGVLLVVAIAVVVGVAANKGDGDVAAGLRNLTDAAASAAQLSATGTDENGHTQYAMPSLGFGDDSSVSATGGSGSTVATSALSTNQAANSSPSVDDGLYHPAQPTTSSVSSSETSLGVATSATASTSSSPTSTPDAGLWQPSLTDPSTGSATTETVAPDASAAPVLGMTTLTWGTEVVTVAAGGPTNASPQTWQALSMSAGRVSQGAAYASAISSLVSMPAPSSTQPSSMASPVSANYSTSQFSMATAPEDFQTYAGAANYFYADGHLSPCGISGNDTDYLVALPSALYTSSIRGDSKVESTLCGSQILITSKADGRTIVGTVSSSCTRCEENGLDVSLAIYQALNPKAKDELNVIWGFLDESSKLTSAVASATDKSFWW